MKYRDYKTFRTGCYYHIYNRGVDKQPIFFQDQDYVEFIKRFRIILGFSDSLSIKTRIQQLPREAFSIVAYCLMNNHFHFLIRQNSNIGIDKLILKLCTSYSSYINKKYERVGTLFQGRFKAKLIDGDEYAQHVSAYIHRNPGDYKNYKYSSYQEIIGLKPPKICDPPLLLSWFDSTSSVYEKFVEQFVKFDDAFDEGGPRRANV